MREEARRVAQERALTLHPPELLEEGKGDDFGVGKPFYGFVASGAARVEETVGVVHEAEEHGERIFQMDERGGMLRSGHPRFLSPGVRMAPFYRQSTQHTSRLCFWDRGVCSNLSK